jgi:hypothetical protein
MSMREKWAPLLAVAGLLVVCGVALAYWTQSGAGAGSASGGATAAIVVNQTSAVTGLYPGGPAVPLAGTFTNSNSGAVNISALTATVRAFASHAVDATKPDCTQADFAIGGSSGANVVPVGTSVGAWSGLTVRMVDNGLNQDNCKNVAITIDYAASA